MEALVSQDFEFNMLSKAYGEFLVECATSYPDGRVERVPSGIYLFKDGNTIAVNFQSPESIAVFLKLKFGAYLRVRPEPKPEVEADFKDILDQLRKRQTKKYYDYDFSTSIKEYNELQKTKMEILKSRNEINQKVMWDESNKDFAESLKRLTGFDKK